MNKEVSVKHPPELEVTPFFFIVTKKSMLLEEDGDQSHISHHLSFSFLINDITGS